MSFCLEEPPGYGDDSGAGSGAVVVLNTVSLIDVVRASFSDVALLTLFSCLPLGTFSDE